MRINQSTELNENLLAKLDAILKLKSNRVIYTPELLADYLNKSTKTIHKWKNTGQLKFSQIDSCIFFQENHVQEFLDKNLVVTNQKRDYA